MDGKQHTIFGVTPEQTVVPDCRTVLYDSQPTHF